LSQLEGGEGIADTTVSQTVALFVEAEPNGFADRWGTQFADWDKGYARRRDWQSSLNPSERPDTWVSDPTHGCLLAVGAVTSEPFSAVIREKIRELPNPWRAELTINL